MDVYLVVGMLTGLGISLFSFIKISIIRKKVRDSGYDIECYRKYHKILTKYSILSTIGLLIILIFGLIKNYF
jgi:hypothetical protein